MTYSERELIEMIRGVGGDLVAEGAWDFSDDAACLPPVREGTFRVVTTDLVQEEIDFSVGLGPLDSAGFRAVTQNTSDLCAMGAKPVGMVWSLAIPTRWLAEEAAWLRAFLEGAATACRTQGLDWYGGDLSYTEGPMTCAVTAFGDVSGPPVRRSTAGAGDRIFVSRPVGASARGLAILLQGRRQHPTFFVPAHPTDIRAAFARWSAGLSDEERACVTQHLWPTPELELARSLAGRATGCIDISDGLALDLSRLCAASQLAGVIRSFTPVLDAHAKAAGANDADAASSGEEYALVFTAPADADLSSWGPSVARAIEVGVTKSGEGLFLGDGDPPTPLRPTGWDHFRRDAPTDGS